MRYDRQWKNRLFAALAALGIGMAGPAGAATIGASLQDRLDTMTSVDTAEVIVSFHGEGAPTEDQLAMLENLGLGGIHMRALPIAGVVATPDQIEQLDARSEVRSLWLNEHLEYDNDRSTAITGSTACALTRTCAATSACPPRARASACW